MFNITLGLQACNFLITYGILRRFFFRPVLRQIELEGHEQARILHFIDRSRAILRDSYCQQQDLWLKARSQFERQLIFCEKLVSSFFLNS